MPVLGRGVPDVAFGAEALAPFCAGVLEFIVTPLSGSELVTVVVSTFARGVAEGVLAGVGAADALDEP